MPPEEIKESSSSTAVQDPPSYQPPANEPQGLEPNKEPDPKDTTATDAKVETVKLPASIKPPAKTGRFQERISDLVNQRDLSKREADQLREEISRMRGITKPGDQAKTVASADGTLNPEDFPTYGDYVRALSEKVWEEKEQAKTSQQAKQTYETQKAERMAAFNEHAAPLAQQYGEGFWDTITDPSLPITEAMADAVMELDNLGPFTMLYLAAHRDEAKKIAGMNPRAATVAIGRLAAQLDYEIKGGNGSAEQRGAPLSGPTGRDAATGGVQQARPTPVPTPRGSSPSLNGLQHQDKDTIEEFVLKERARLRSINPNARFYGG